MVRPKLETRARINHHLAGLALIATMLTGGSCATSETLAPGQVASATNPTDPTRASATGAPSTTLELGACAAIATSTTVRAALPAREKRDAATGEKALKEGLAIAERGRYPEALAAYQRAIAADPYLGLAYLEAAEAHLYTDDDRPVMSSLLANALELLPKNPRVHNRYASVLSELGESKRAIAHWRCALELRPDLVDARKSLGAELLRAGDLSAAEAELRKAVTDAPDDVQAHVGLADVLEAERNLLEAAREVEAAGKLAKKNAGLYRRAATLYETAGNVAAAKRANGAADKIDPPARERTMRPLPKARGGE